LHVAWDGRLAGYDFGAGHPLAPVRLELTIELARAFGLFAAAGVSVKRPAPATDAELGLVHIQPYRRGAAGRRPAAGCSGAGIRPGNRGQPGVRGHA
jgi:acetoin utilization protein AcuC